MLTPQEVSEHTFQKATLFGAGGYDMGQVDEFLDILTGDYSALYNENAVLKNKMKVLVDKVEEYRSTEEAMRKALMAAQQMADNLLKEAEEKKSEMLAQAEAEVRDRKVELSRELETEEYRLKQAQAATAAFVEQVRAIHATEEECLSRLEELYPPETKPHVETVDEKVSEIDGNVQRLLAQAMEAATAENMRAKAQAEPDEDLSDTAEFTPGASREEDDLPPEDEEGYEDEDEGYEDEEEDEDDHRRPRGGRIDFGRLQFGRNYEIT